jgi:hypothetical protein
MVANRCSDAVQWQKKLQSSNSLIYHTPVEVLLQYIPISQYLTIETRAILAPACAWLRISVKDFQQISKARSRL